MSSEITKIEGQIFELTKRLAKLRAESTGTEVRNYSFDTSNGQTTLIDLFGDLYCSIWPFLGMAGMTEADWTPQFKYWSRPQKMDDGGENLVD